MVRCRQRRRSGNRRTGAVVGKEFGLDIVDTLVVDLAKDPTVAASVEKSTPLNFSSKPTALFAGFVIRGTLGMLEFVLREIY